ncbi:hypothetical protein KQX54_001794 [Cotesia glomerata]|uniref:Uncharacterized protein n=1 Tax=Cotesia glomerata TaxID=32391 RepID=A0AAV7IAQ1_COTGL|nr:hypothetical protein KQX54_001794 [Cotesia glomerata]
MKFRADKCRDLIGSFVAKVMNWAQLSHSLSTEGDNHRLLTTIRQKRERLMPVSPFLWHNEKEEGQMPGETSLRVFALALQLLSTHPSNGPLLR